MFFDKAVFWDDFVKKIKAIDPGARISSRGESGEDGLLRGVEVICSEDKEGEVKRFVEEYDASSCMKEMDARREAVRRLAELDLDVLGDGLLARTVADLIVAGGYKR